MSVAADPGPDSPPPTDSVDIKKRCGQCSNRHGDPTKVCRRRPDRLAAKRKSRLASGLCECAGCKNPPVAGRVGCEFHRLAHRKRSGR